MNKFIIETKNLKKSYEHINGKITLFNNFNLKLKEGELVALVGPSGSGKSSLLHLIALLDKPSKGKIIINREETKNLSEAINLLTEEKRKVSSHYLIDTNGKISLFFPIVVFPIIFTCECIFVFSSI